MKNNERVTVVNYSKLSLEELKMKAQELKIKGRSKMNKADLVEAITTIMNTETELQSALDNSAKGNVKSLGDFTKHATESYVDVIVAGIREAREVRSNKGRRDGERGDVTLKTTPEDKAMAYRLQRGSVTAKLTGKQSKRVRKTQAKRYNLERGSMVCFGDVPGFTYS